MKKFIVSFILLSPLFVMSQMKGIIPFTHAKYETYGISFKDIEFKLAKNTWLSNRLPINTEFEIKLIKPSGFKVFDDICFPAVSVFLSKNNGDTLGYSTDILKNRKGFNIDSLSNLSISLSFNNFVKVGDTCNLRVTFYDTKSENFTKVDFPMYIVESFLPIENSNAVYSEYGLFETKSNLDLGKSIYKEDTTEYVVYKKLAFDTINLNYEEFKSGKETITFYDNHINKVKKMENFKIDVKPNTENDKKMSFNILLTDLSNYAHSNYYFHYRWESKDKLKVFEIILNFYY
ncbi:MAG: hypothetical protein V4622_05300 [Bacteroidota bacterium]